MSELVCWYYDCENARPDELNVCPAGGECAVCVVTCPSCLEFMARRSPTLVRLSARLDEFNPPTYVRLPNLLDALMGEESGA